MEEWQPARGFKGGVKAAAPEQRTNQQWLTAWDFYVGDLIVFRPPAEAPNRSEYTVRVNGKTYVAHVSTAWGAGSQAPGAVGTWQQAAGLLRDFHVTVEEYGRHDSRNPRYFFSWDLAGAPQLVKSNPREGVSDKDVRGVAETFTIECAALFKTLR